MFLGRQDERLALDRLFAQARAGLSGVLAFVGEPGIGKTSLLEQAAAGAEGMRILRCRGIESEAVIPFAGLAELLRPILDAIDEIPAPQAAALTGALALGPGAAGDRFAIGAATLSLLTSSAEQTPLAVLVDDAHWLDRPSAEALLFAARRLLADPIAVVLTVREGESSLLDGADLRTVRIAGLNRSEVTELLSARGGAEVSDHAIERLFRATGGNPLALQEFARDSARLGASVPTDAPIPISTSIATSFLRRFGELPQSTHRLLLVVAAAGRCHVGVLARAAAQLGLEIDALSAGEQAGLVRLGHDAVVVFAHPLARAAIYADASAVERREAHAALAAALPDRDLDKRAWHLAAASVGADEVASAALERAADRARDRSAYAAAADAYVRAAELASSGEAGERLMLCAADTSWLAGDHDGTLELLDRAEAYEAAPAASRQARVDQLRGEVAMRCGPLREGCDLIVAAAERLLASDPERAVSMLAQAVIGRFYAGDTPAMAALAERAAVVAADAPSPRTTLLAAMSSAIALVVSGQGGAGAAAARDAVQILEQTGDLHEDPALLAWIAFGPLLLRETEAGRHLLELAFERARSEGAVGSLPYALHLLARDQATTDQWPAAIATYDETIRLGLETGQRVVVAAALAGLAWLEARQGREAGCREHALAAKRQCEELGIGFYGIWSVQALGDLELGLGRPAAAVERYQEQEQQLRAHGIGDVDLSPAPELVDALLRLGQPESARAATVEFSRRASAKGQPWALARAARCEGLVAEAAQIESCFERALELHAQTPDAFETARTRFSFGTRLRRARKRVRAREQLRAAIDTFDSLGARSWLEQATAELAATGETARRRDVSTLDQLTPQELRIARLLAAGKTTRETAAAVFLSPKTVEYHLGHVYSKLGINSRDELAAALSG